RAAAGGSAVWRAASGPRSEDHHIAINGRVGQPMRAEIAAIAPAQAITRCANRTASRAPAKAGAFASESDPFPALRPLPGCGDDSLRCHSRADRSRQLRAAPANILIIP